MKERLSAFLKWIAEAWADDTFKRNLFISSCSVLIVMLCVLLVGSCKDHVVYVYEPFIEIPEGDNDILDEDDLLVPRKKHVLSPSMIGTRPSLELFDRMDDVLESPDPLDFLNDPVEDSIREAKRQADLKFFGLSPNEKDSLQPRKRDSLSAESFFLQRDYEPTPDFLDKVYDMMSDRPVLIAVLAFGVFGAALVIWIIMTLILAPFQWLSRKSKTW